MDSTGQKSTSSESSKPQTKKMCLACNQTFEGNMTNCPKDGTQLVTFGGDDNLGKVVNERYKILEKVGQGGMGAVYLAEVLGKKNSWVAIKMLHAQLSEDKVSVKRFQQEASAASDLQHPNLIAQYDYGMIDGKQPFLVMEYLEGESLAEMIKEQGPINPVQCCRIFSQVMDGLQYAHDKGVVHRDIKPSNILLIRRDGEEIVKVLDFGLAKLMPWSGKESQHLTKTGEVFGSPIYMSPEQCMGKKLEPSSDIYSLGITLFEALTGKPPFKGQNVVQTASKHLSDAPPTFESIRPDLNLPLNLQNVVFRSLEKETTHRFLSMNEFKKDLVYAVTGQGQASARAMAASSYATDATQPVKRVDLDNIKASTSSSSQLRAAEAAAQKKAPFALIAGIVGAILVIGGGVGAFMFFSNADGPRDIQGEIFYVDTDVNPPEATERIPINEIHVNTKKGLVKLTSAGMKRDDKAKALGIELALGRGCGIHYVGNDKTGQLKKFSKKKGSDSDSEVAANVVINFFLVGSAEAEPYRFFSKSYLDKHYAGLSVEKQNDKLIEDLRKKPMRIFNGEESKALPTGSEPFLSTAVSGSVPLKAFKIVSAVPNKVVLYADGDRLFKDPLGYMQFTVVKEGEFWKIDDIKEKIPPDDWREALALPASITLRSSC